MVPLSWGELSDFITKKGGDFLDESVTIYDLSAGEYYPCDTIEFEEDDDVLDKGAVFLKIET